MKKTLFYFLLCVCACAMGEEVPLEACPSACQNIVSDEVNFRSCMIACREAALARFGHSRDLLYDDVIDEGVGFRKSQNPLRDYLINNYPLEGVQGDYEGGVDSEGQEVDRNPVDGNDIRNPRVLFTRTGRASSFVRIGRSPMEKRASSFVRIGRSSFHPDRKVESGWINLEDGMMERPLADYDEESSNNFRTYGEDKRASSFVRIGRSVEDRRHYPVRVRKSVSDPESKRASSFVRIGKSSPENYDGGEEPMRGYYAGFLDAPVETEEGKRASSFVRIGKSTVEDEEGMSQETGEEGKRASSFIRIGKSPVDEEEKRASSFIRIGKSQGDEEEKRASSFIRIGKSQMDKEEEEEKEEEEKEKRASSFVRIGRTPSEEEKRASSFVRIGKSSTSVERRKRSNSFVRIGKSDTGNHRHNPNSEHQSSNTNANQIRSSTINHQSHQPISLSPQNQIHPKKRRSIS